MENRLKNKSNQMITKSNQKKKIFRCKIFCPWLTKKRHVLYCQIVHVLGEKKALNLKSKLYNVHYQIKK